MIFKKGATLAFERLFEREKKEFKVGDVVRIRKDLRVNIREKESEYGGCFVVEDMKKFFGKKAKIAKVIDKNRYRVEVNGKESTWCWSAEMFE